MTKLLKILHKAMKSQKPLKIVIYDSDNEEGLVSEFWAYSASFVTIRNRKLKVNKVDVLTLKVMDQGE